MLLLLLLLLHVSVCVYMCIYTGGWVHVRVYVYACLCACVRVCVFVLKHGPPVMVGMLLYRVDQNHIYKVYIQYFWQGNHQINGHIKCIYSSGQPY